MPDQNTDNDLIANKLKGRIYCGNFTGGKYISVATYKNHTPIDDNDIAVLNISPHIELRISYISNRDNINGFRIKKIKYDSTQKKWVNDGEVSLSKFTISDLVGLCDLLSKISLKNITQSKIDIENLSEIKDEEELERQLRTIAATPKGRKIISAIAKTQSITETDIINVVFRKEQLDIFKSLLNDQNFFEAKKIEWSCIRDEDVWQKFFENNQWVFGYGLSLVSCESFDDKKLEQIVSGASVFHPGGKRIDAILKTRGFIKSLMFTEIKTHKTSLLKNGLYRKPDTYQINDELSGATAQVQKTIHKTLLKLGGNSVTITSKSGDPTGEEIAITQPKGVVIVGSLKEFETEYGINFEKFTTFELHRRGIYNPEIITFDELYERARFIVQENSSETEKKKNDHSDIPF